MHREKRPTPRGTCLGCKKTKQSSYHERPTQQRRNAVGMALSRTTRNLLDLFKPVAFRPRPGPLSRCSDTVAMPPHATCLLVCASRCWPPPVGVADYVQSRRTSRPGWVFECGGRGQPWGVFPRPLLGPSYSMHGVSRPGPWHKPPTHTTNRAPPPHPFSHNHPPPPHPIVPTTGRLPSFLRPVYATTEQDGH